MKPQTALDICNLALAKLGEAPLAGIDLNGSPAARLCYMHYHPTRREVLCSNSWKFAIKAVWLSAVDGQFPIPGDCLRILSASAPNWTLRGRAITCDCKNVHIKYIADIEDVTQFSRMFIDAFATLLASKLALPLTFSVLTAGKLDNEYKTLIS